MIARKLTAIFLVLALIFSLTSCAVIEEETIFNGMVLLETNTIKDSGIYQYIMYDQVAQGKNINNVVVNCKKPLK